MARLAWVSPIDHGLVELGGGDQLLQKPDQPEGEIEIAPLAMLQHGVVTLPLTQDLGRKTQGAARQQLTAGTWPGSSCSPSMAAVPRLSRPSRADTASWARGVSKARICPSSCSRA